MTAGFCWCTSLPKGLSALDQYQGTIGKQSAMKVARSVLSRGKTVRSYLSLQSLGNFVFTHIRHYQEVTCLAQNRYLEFVYSLCFLSL